MVSVGTMRTPAENGVARSGSRNHALNDRFLLPDQSLGASEVEFAGGDERLGAGQLKRSKRSHFNLALVIFVELPRRSQRLLLYLDVFIQAHQVVIEPADTEDKSLSCWRKTSRETLRLFSAMRM